MDVAFRPVLSRPLTWTDRFADELCTIAKTNKNSGPRIPKQARPSLSRNLASAPSETAAMLGYTATQQHKEIVARHDRRML